jgi:hypothetical protein
MGSEDDLNTIWLATEIRVMQGLADHPVIKKQTNNNKKP